MGIAGDTFYCPTWEPKTREAEERLERWLREARESVWIGEAGRERENKEHDLREE